MGEGTASAPVVARPAWGDDLARFGDHPALSTPTGTVTYADLDRRVAQAREDLAALGPGQLVRLRPATTTDFVVAWLAACTGSHAALVTHDDGLARAFGVSVERGAGDWHPTGRTAPALHPDLRLLLSTSGSTGSPKLVRLSATNLDANADAIADYLGLGHGDVALTTLPLDYCYGLSVLHSHLLVGATVVLDDRSVTDPALWVRAREERVTSFAGVPHTFDLLGAAGWPHLPSLRQVTQAGGRLAPERVQALADQGRREGWDLVVMYGQTEATARMAWLPPDLAATHPATVGVPIPGGSFRLAPVEGAQEGVGELVYAGPNVMMGYAESPADLARGPEIDELPTGDLARFTPEGLVEIVGRRSRFAKLFGQRIDLDRVQTLLGLGGLDVVCAESADGAQLVIAVPGCTGAGDDVAALDEVRTVAAEATGLPAHALLVVPVGEVPRLPNGKVDHQSVARLVPRTSIEPADPEASIARLYARILGVSEVSPARSFVDLGGDSLSYVELSLRLEQRIGRLPEDWPTWSIADLSALAGGLDRAERPRRSWARVDTTIVLRALAIVLIVGSHTDLWVVLGGAHVLLAVAGANFARFSLADEGPRARLRRIGRAASRIAVPAVLWIGAVAVLTGAPGWRSVLLVNDVLGSHDWSEPNWYYWFIEVVLLCCLGAGLLAAIPRVTALERRHRFALALTLAGVALVPRWWATWSSYDGDVIHSSVFVAWLFLGGWAAQVAGNRRQRALVTAVLLAGVVGFTGSVERDLLIAAGVVSLVWAPSVPWPRVLVASTGTVASASLYIYLTHWQVYPWFEDRWPLGGLIASLAVGIATWRLVERVSAGSRHEDPRRRRTPTPSGASPTSNLPSNTPIGTR